MNLCMETGFRIIYHIRSCCRCACLSMAIKQSVSNWFTLYHITSHRNQKHNLSLNDFISYRHRRQPLDMVRVLWVLFHSGGTPKFWQPCCLLELALCHDTVSVSQQPLTTSWCLANCSKPCPTNASKMPTNTHLCSIICTSANTKTHTHTY